MIFSNKYIFIRYSIRNKTQPLLIITLEFPSTLARLAYILWLRAKLCITLVSLPPKKIITKPKTKVLFIATANDLKTVSRWILWNIIDNSLQGKPFEPNWCFFQGLWGIEWRSYMSLVTVWRTNSPSPRGLSKQLFLLQIPCPQAPPSTAKKATRAGRGGRWCGGGGDQGGCARLHTRGWSQVGFLSIWNMQWLNIFHCHLCY